MTELKPCPFCGEKAHIGWGANKLAYVGCWKCPATILGFYGQGKKGWHHPKQIHSKTSDKLREELIEAWNRRASNENLI